MDPREYLHASAMAKTPKPQAWWVARTPLERKLYVVNALYEFAGTVQIVSAEPNGHVIVKLLKPLPADERGTLLLTFEENLRRQVDRALTVWLEPMGDKNTLRNLRGIEVKS